MTEHELRDKIVDVIIANEHKGEKNIRGETIKKYLRIADALIAAGIGDVSEYMPRAEKAERALKDMCRAYEVLKGTSFNELFCETTCRYVLSLEKAEKELQEERKDD